jgi:cytochrome b561
MYSKLMKWLHTFMAILILGALGVGFVMTDMEPTDFKWQVYGIHKSIGFLVALFFIVRVIARLTTNIPDHPKDLTPLHLILSKMSPYVLYLGMGVMAFSGYLMSDFSGKGVNVFNLINIPTLFPNNAAVSGALHWVHMFVALPFAVLVGAHILASLYHHFVLKNNLLHRMFR